MRDRLIEPNARPDIAVPPDHALLCFERLGDAAGAFSIRTGVAEKYRGVTGFGS
jgi:hypothetical protein